jgi:hypothetical protein
VALDFGALFSNTTGSDNVASGTGALLSNTTGERNLASGTEALKSNTTGSDNLAFGTDALASNTEANNNLAIGRRALFNNTTGNGNIASGNATLLSDTTGSENLASGVESLRLNTTGHNNVATGTSALFNNTTGSGNAAVGTNAGRNLTSGSNNIDIANEGVAAEERTTRIGSEGTQTRAFVAGVYKKPVTTPACAVKVNSEGQLGCNPEENSTAIATFASRTKALSGNCLAYTDIAPAGSGACAAKTSGFSSSTRLAPTPANGGTATSLYADSSATVSGTDTALVAVIDNTTGATLLSCTVTSSSPHGCSNASGSGSAAAGDNIEVKLTATGVSGKEKLWRVTFRF